MSTTKNSKQQINNSKTHKPWFTVQCKFQRQNYRKLKRKYKRYKTEAVKNELAAAERQYKRTLDTSMSRHRKDMQNKLKTMRTKNPKEFWKILNKSKRKEQPDIPVDTFFEFYKELNQKPNQKDTPNLPEPEVQETNQINEEINKYIDKNEILNCIKKLKCNKASGEDYITNEYIKATATQFINIYEKLFNVIFDTGIIPDIWLIGSIKPIFKNKGNKYDPNNFRPITILSCLGKLFTSILNDRLNTFSEEFKVLNESQCGFRKQYSTIDSIFILYSFFECLKSKNKKLFCAFVDFEKAFDKVWREALWYKLLLNNINGKMYRLILNMYDNIKSCVVYNNCKSDFFRCENGVRQGENLSPFLFSIFLNDLESYLQSKDVSGLTTLSEEIENQLNVYLKLFVILYADDTVIMSETKEDLQKQLDVFSEYCKFWQLKVNVEKTKILVFSRGRLPNNLTFTFNEMEIGIVSEFNYLGVLLSKSGNFSMAKKAQVEKATKAMFEVLKRGKIHNLSIQCQLDLFDKIITPILLYGCEVWGFSKNEIIERVHLRFCKLLLNFKTSTPSYMVYGELGRYPLDIDIKVRTISFWAKLISGKQTKLSAIIYKCMYNMLRVRDRNFMWLKYVKHILCNCGFNYIWESQTFINELWLKHSIKQNLTDQYLQTWLSSVNDSPKALNYRIYKDNLVFENYLNILNDKDNLTLSKFRTTNHKLPVENGRWKNIARENRICPLCNNGEIGDEFHYLFKCQYFGNQRKIYIKKNIRINLNIIKFKLLMASTSKVELQKLCRFVRIINKGVSTSCYDLSVYIVNSVHIFISLYLYALWFKRNKESE